MKFLNETPPPYDLTYNDVFMVPSMSNVGSRLDVDLSTPDNIGTTIPLVVANMTAVAGRRMAETVSRRGGLVVLPQDIPLDVIESVVKFVKSRHPIYETPITLTPTDTVGEALSLIHKRAHGVVIVTDNDQRPLGIFTEADAGGYDRFTQLHNVMSTELLCIQEGTDLEEIFHALSNQRLTAAPVTNNEGRLIGCVTRRGALRSTLYTPALNCSGNRC
jgi:IMP dehydrogenase